MDYKDMISKRAEKAQPERVCKACGDKYIPLHGAGRRYCYDPKCERERERAKSQRVEAKRLEKRKAKRKAAKKKMEHERDIAWAVLERIQNKVNCIKVTNARLSDESIKKIQDFLEQTGCIKKGNEE